MCACTDCLTDISLTLLLDLLNWFEQDGQATVGKAQVLDLTCPLPRSNLLGWFQAANLQGWSLPASSVQSWPRPNPPTPEQTQTCTWLHHAEQYITVGKPKALWLSESLKYRVVMCTVGGSHHRYDWSRAHVADQFPEERLTPQVQVVLPKKLLRCLTHKTDTFN